MSMAASCAAGDERPWLDGGLGKLRYGNGDDGAFNSRAPSGQGYALLTPEFWPSP